MKFFGPQMRAKKFHEAQMLKTRIFATEHEIDARLVRFGATRSELIEVAKQIVAARADSIVVDPLSAPGQLSYIYGTRHLRLLFMSKGWNIDRKENVESVVSPGGTRIVFQNVDDACSIFQHPKAISAKGPASHRMIDVAQGRLFGPGELPETIPPKALDGLNSSAWYFCMSFDDDNIKAELSLPASVKGGNFFGFLERIFIITGGDWGSAPAERNDAPVEALPIVTRR
jgi:hypothetical protein